jgi:phosphatidylserine decarboxylase
MENLIHLGIKSQKYLPDEITDVFTKKICSKIGRSRKFSNKLRFAKTYKIRWEDSRKCKETKSVEECVRKFSTLDDLFAREIKPQLTQPESTELNAIVSPAECYARKVAADKNFNIKGASYSLKKLLNKDDVPSKSEIFIFRLAPEQYHRIHSPIKSKIVKITAVGGTYKSVNPILLDDVPVLQENYRKIIEFENGMYMVTVGATCVGSVNLSVKEGEQVVHGQDMGAFGFGGSCIALVVPYKIVKYNNNISTNEKLFRPGQIVCRFALRKVNK